MQTIIVKNKKKQIKNDYCENITFFLIALIPYPARQKTQFN